VGQGMKVAVSGVVIGLLTALVVTRLLSSLLFGIGAADAFTFAAHDHPACSRIGGLLRASRTCHYCGTCGSFTQRVKRQGRMKPPMDADGANENRHSSACIGGSFALLSGGTNFRADRDAILSV